MKYIENSVEVVCSQEGKGEMASCEVFQVNGDMSPAASMKKDLKPKEDGQTPNGVVDKDDKTNGETNGFYDEGDDEEFHLVLDASSEDGSPLKSEISAEALTQEITALLGESREGIDEELKKIDGLKTDELNEEEEAALLNGEGLSQSSIEDKTSADSNADINISEKEQEDSEVVKEKEESDVIISEVEKEKEDPDVSISEVVEEKKDSDVSISEVVEEKKDSDVSISEVVEEKKDSDVSISEVVEEKKDSDVNISEVVEEKKDSEVSISEEVKEKEDSDVIISEVDKEKEDSDVSISEVVREKEDSDISILEVERENESLDVEKEKEDSDVSILEIEEEKEEDKEDISSKVENEKVEDLEDPKQEISQLEEDIWLDGEPNSEELPINDDAQLKEKNNKMAVDEDNDIIKTDDKLIVSSKQISDIPLSQTSDMSENDGWTVIDSVETSEDEDRPSSQEVKNNKELLNKDAESNSEEIIASSEAVIVDEISETTQAEDKSRKRSASVDDEVVEQKKVKLDTEDKLEEKASSKRFSSDLLENETKRTRLNGILSEDEDCEMLPSKKDVLTNKGVVSKLKEDKSNDDTETLEVKETSDSALETSEKETSLKSTVPNESMIEVCSSAVVEEPPKDEDDSDVLMEEVLEASGNEGIPKAVGEEKSEVLTEEKPCKIQNISEVEIIENEPKDEPSSQTKVKETTNTEQVKKQSVLPKDSIPAEVKQTSKTVLQTEIPDVQELLNKEVVPTTKNVTESKKSNECVNERKEKPQAKSDKVILSSDSSKATTSLPVSSKTTTSKTKEEETKVKLDSEEKTNKTEIKVSKDEKKVNDASKDNKRLSKDGFVENKMTYKLTPIETEIEKTPSIKRKALPSNEQEPSEKKTVSNNVLKLKPEIDLKKPVEEKKTYASLQPMKVYPIEEDKKQTAETKTESVTNLDKAIESVVKKSRCSMFMVLKKFHKDQLRKMTRTELEETVVLKICEAVTDKSEIGQMRQKCKSLEQDLDSWKKKAVQYEKQIRELDMVVKRFLTEAESLAGQKDSKPPLPIKVTRSVGLQVVLASSMHGQLVNKNKQYQQQKQLQQQQQQQMQQQKHQQQLQMASKQKLAERLAKEQQMKSAATYTPPVQQNTAPPVRKGPGRPPRSSLPPAPATVSKPAPAPNKPTVPTQKPVTISKPPTPVKQTPPTTPSKDLTIIDLTEKEDRPKPTPPNPASSGGGIRVAPQTQVCFVQQSAATATTPTQMAYIVQKPGQRQQYLVATSSASPPKPTQTTRPPPALATVPSYRTPVTSSQQGVRTQSTVNSPHKPAVQAMRPQPTAPTPPNNIIKKHPAPLPAAPVAPKRPGQKLPPSKPLLKIAKTVTGIMLSWSMTLADNMADMASYQLYAYQESNQPPTTSLWKKVGDVKALPLPMACTLTQFIEGHKYHFAVRAVDVHGRIGPFSHPGSILLKH